MLWVRRIWVSSFRIRRRWASVACFLPTSNEAAQPSVPSARPWESEVFHWHQIRFSASFWHRYECQLIDTKPRVYQWKGQDHKGIRPKVSFLWCHMAHSACRMSPWKVALLSHHANNIGWTAKVQLVVSLSRVALCLHSVAYLLVSHFCISYSQCCTFFATKNRTAGKSLCIFVLSHPFTEERHERNVWWVGRQDFGLQPVGIGCFAWAWKSEQCY